MQKNAHQGTFAESPDAPQPLRLSGALRNLVDFVGRWSSWLIIPLVLVTVMDVVSRKLVWTDAAGRAQGVQIWLVDWFGRIFESTLLQETEWHLHAALFALVLGFGTIYNTHVRVDLVRARLGFRKQAWLEFAGLTFFMIPFLLLIIWFTAAYAHESYLVGEVSSSTVGLTHRWLIKSVLVLGLIVAAIAGVAVWLQVAQLLWGKQDRRFPLMTLEWPDEAGSRIEGKDRITLEDAAAEPDVPPVLAAQPQSNPAE